MKRRTRPGPWAIFQRELLPTTILGAALSAGAQGGYYAITTFLPTFLRTERHLTVLGSGFYLAIIIIGSWCGYIASAYWSDMIGRRKNFFIFAIGSLVIAVAYTEMQISDSMMLVLGFPLGFFASGIFSGMGPLFTELFPTSVRGAGQGFCYNFGRGLGAFFPVLVGVVSASTGLGPAIGIFAAHCVRHCDSRRPRAAGNARKGIAGGLKDGRYYTALRASSAPAASAASLA